MSSGSAKGTVRLNDSAIDTLNEVSNVLHSLTENVAMVNEKLEMVFGEKERKDVQHLSTRLLSSLDKSKEENLNNVNQPKRPRLLR
mmetsp:Transcript_13934/g.15880  ORF Transcript_13934/g.15880 Transcript_13934/m.15880 type:complete len:86 (+) Transcript_13934:161-418(+)